MGAANIGNPRNDFGNVNDAVGRPLTIAAHKTDQVKGPEAYDHAREVYRKLISESSHE
jgi:hypothetical protein